MTHFVNDASTVVTSAIDGLIRSSGGTLARLDGYPDVKVVLRADADPNHVAVISGGGAGHEPTHAGFVGPGLLTAAVSGEIFASPSVEAVLAAIMSVTGPAGCLLIVKNYTGDRLNFGLAAERARALGHQVELVVVSDDIALREAAQPRGIAGTLFVHKIAGAKSDAGASLAEVVAAARAAAGAVRSLGVSLSGADIPHRAPAREFPAGTAELGLGIHGEPGAETVAVDDAHGLITRMVERLLAALPADGPVAVLLNNLGGVSPLEMQVVADDLLASALGPRVDLIIGPAPLMTSISMRGFSVSVLPLTEGVQAALLAPVGPTVAWPGAHAVSGVSTCPVPMLPASETAAASDDPQIRAMLTAASAALLDQRDALDALDAKVGDGDTGSTFAAAAQRLLDDLDQLPMAEPAALLARLADLVSLSMGGSSGVLLSIMFTAAATALADGATFVDAVQQGIDTMQRYGGARPGDRTMLDALVPAVERLRAGGDLTAAAGAADDGARATAGVTTTGAGRSSYVPAEHLRGVEDPGARAVAVAIAAMAAAR